MYPNVIIRRISLCVASCLFILLMPLGIGQAVEFVVIMQDVYKQGDTATVDISAKLIDPENVIKEAVLFLNVVEIDEAQKFPQAAHLIFADASSPNDITKKVFTGEQLKAGLSTTVTFLIKEDAKPADYSLVLQLFNGNNTDPNRVKFEDRIDIKSFRFTIEPK